VIAVNNHSSSIPLGDLASRFAAFGWAATTVDGRDHERLYEALSQRDAERPSVVVADVEPKGE
jgi:transketolase